MNSSGKGTVSSMKLSSTLYCCSRVPGVPAQRDRLNYFHVPLGVNDRRIDNMAGRRPSIPSIHLRFFSSNSTGSRKNRGKIGRFGFVGTASERDNARNRNPTVGKSDEFGRESNRGSKPFYGYFFLSFFFFRFLRIVAFYVFDFFFFGRFAQFASQNRKRPFLLLIFASIVGCLRRSIVVSLFVQLSASWQGIINVMQRRDPIF